MTPSSDAATAAVDPGPLGLAAFNAADVAAAESVLRPCLDVDRWVAEIVAARPYLDHHELLARASGAAQPLTAEEIETAMSHHPRIGEAPRATTAEAAHSTSEQSGLDIDGDVKARLVAGNRAYEEHFGRVFLIRAAGRSSAEILDTLQERLGNDPDTELVVVGEQLREIALLRLESRVGP